jgi:hypothetical protein
MTDKILVGKLQGCRVCDVIQDQYEYLIWAEKAGLMKFTKIVVETIQEHAGFKNQQRHYEEEIEPWFDQTDEILPVIIDGDVPF